MKHPNVYFLFFFLFFFIILDWKSFIKIKHNLFLPIFIHGIQYTQYSLWCKIAKKFFTKVVFYAWNALKLFTLILVGNVVLDFEQISFRKTAFSNGICSIIEVLLYFKSVYNCIFLREVQHLSSSFSYLQIHA